MSDIKEFSSKLAFAWAVEKNHLKNRIQELEDGSCRFNCRTMKQAFIAGYLADSQHGEHSEKAAEMAYKEWKNQ